MSGYILQAFQVPNNVVDRIMWLLTDPELRVLIYMTRHILGWVETKGTRKARISLSHFVDGYTTAQGVHFAGCGLSKGAVRTALESLQEFGIVAEVGERNNEGTLWELAFMETDRVDEEALQERADKKAKAATKRTVKARKVAAKKRNKNEGVLSDNTPDGGTVGQHTGGLSHNTQGVLSDNPNKSIKGTSKSIKDIAADAAQPFEAGNGLQHDFANDEAGSTVVVADPTPEEVEADIAACEEKDLRGELFEAIAKGFFNLTSTEGLDRTSAARIGKLVKWLMELDTPATVDELRQFWKAYKIKYGGIDLPRTIEKLSLHFQEFRQDGLKPNLTIIAHPSHRPAQLDTQQEQAPEVVAANLAMLDDLDAVEPSMEESA